MSGLWYDRLQFGGCQPHSHGNHYEIEGVLFMGNVIDHLQHLWLNTEPEDLPLAIALLDPSDNLRDFVYLKALTKALQEPTP